VLESIRDLLNEAAAIPPWLHDIFLGYGDPAAAHYSSMADTLPTVDFKVCVGVLRCAVLRCAVLCCAVLCSAVGCCAVRCCANEGWGVDLEGRTFFVRAHRESGGSEEGLRKEVYRVSNPTIGQPNAQHRRTPF